ncbi:hypothetical protein DFH07DRAFT_783246 [Mycena maculata]|uniref:Uncharacterized protein n=1 Tax=Mycena maculata TaxID=230809 RepID=A0AAD7MML9_9AGAR|nr:hypothetical protein DFH07DRAFT_783246 [Mycena maculata]
MSYCRFVKVPRIVAEEDTTTVSVVTISDRLIGDGRCRRHWCSRIASKSGVSIALLLVPCDARRLTPLSVPVNVEVEYHSVSCGTDVPDVGLSPPLGSVGGGSPAAVFFRDCQSCRSTSTIDDFDPPEQDRTSHEHTEAEILPIPPVNLLPELASQGVTNFEDQGINWDANGQRFEARSAPSKGRLVGTFKGTRKEKEPACDARKEENKRGGTAWMPANGTRGGEAGEECVVHPERQADIGKGDTALAAWKCCGVRVSRETPLRSPAAPVPQVSASLNVGRDPPAADNSGDFSEDDNSSSDSNSMNESGDSGTEQGLSGITAERATRLGQGTAAGAGGVPGDDGDYSSSPEGKPVTSVRGGVVTDASKGTRDIVVPVEKISM